MTTHQKLKSLRSTVLATTAQCMAYSWSADFIAKEIKELPEKGFIKRDFGDIDITDLTKVEMEDLGFRRWSEESQVMLIPLWLFPFLPDEITTTDINGETATLKKSEMDTDCRFGVMAYGVVPKE